MKKKVILYYPRDNFLKFWEKRKPEVILTETDDKVKSENFYETGELRREYTRWKNGESIEKTYFLNGQQQSEEVVWEEKHRRTCWDRSGNMIYDSVFNKETGVEIRYYPDGKPKIQHNRKTGEYEEWTDTGVLKKKGHLFSKIGDLESHLDDPYARFITGNMRAKLEDEQRQEYNEAIDAIDGLPATLGRKIAKEALAKEYRKAVGRQRD